MTRTRHLLAPLLTLSLLTATTVRAQEEEDPRTLSAAHFDRGITFFNEERYDAALAEFARAYELTPAYQTLYNLARVHAALGHAVQAAEAYAQYLEEAGDAIGARRRREAEQALEQQRNRIGRLRVASDVDGATVAIDGVDVATTPLDAPLQISAGAHTVELRAPGHETVRRAVTVAGLSEVELSVELREEVIPRGTLRVDASVPEVTIAIDDEPVGLTPLASTVPLRAGPHRVTARRAGYLPESRQVVIEEGAEAELRFEMRRDPAPEPDHVGTLRLELPDAPYLIRVDGETMLGRALDLPRGIHEVTVEVTDRQPYSGVVRVPAGTAIFIVPPLAWTLEARRARLESAAQRRLLGWGVGGAGAAIAVAGLALLVWNETEIASTDMRIVDINAELSGRCVTEGFDSRCEAIAAEGRQLGAEQDTQNVLRGVSIVGTLVGATLGSIGFAVALTTPSDEDIDAAARARASVRLGPGRLTLEGAF